MVSIIDGNHLACRCYFAIDSLTTSNGQPVNLIYGFISSIKTFVKRFGPENYYFIAWDSYGKNFRHEIYPNYKADRKTFPQEFYDQLDLVKEFVDALQVQQFKIKNIEADDIIGSLAYQSRKHGQKVLIISSDHDFEQLITNHIKILSPSLAKSKEFFKDFEYVTTKYGFEPKQLIELMSIIGDSTDNIKGIPGIAETIATRLLKANGSLENILLNYDSLKIFDKNNCIKDASDKIKKKIQDNVELIKLNKKLVTINCTLEIQPKFEQCHGINIEKLTNLFQKYEFKKFLNEIEQWHSIFTVQNI